jgi:ectoine hydroxylase-related dioxygenase (phytanoyl-CoA dioxygenase family)
MPVQLLRSALPAKLCEHWLTSCVRGDGSSRPLPALDGLAAADVLQAVAASALHPLIEGTLGPAPRCNIDQSWLRHGRPPHRWHQDGALRFDFIAHAGRPWPADALLEMLTCWIALTPCGEHAPGLEWVDAPQPALLRPEALDDDSVAARHHPALFRRPILAPGDALLFGGDLLHRTHLTACMTQPRSSLELRFFRAAALPPRLAGDHFLPLVTHIVG